MVSFAHFQRKITMNAVDLDPPVSQPRGKRQANIHQLPSHDSPRCPYHMTSILELVYRSTHLERRKLDKFQVKLAPSRWTRSRHAVTLGRIIEEAQGVPLQVKTRKETEQCVRSPSLAKDPLERRTQSTRYFRRGYQTFFLTDFPV